MATFVISQCNDDLRDALAAIARINEQDIVIRDAAIVETSPELAQTLKALLGRLIVSPDAPVRKAAAKSTGRPPVVVAPAPASALEKRKCEKCGELYQPVRKDQKYCSDECRSGKPKVEQPAGKTPLAEPGAMHWTVSSGDWTGKVLTSGQLANWIVLGNLPEGTLVDHSARGMHMLGKRKGRADLAPIPLEPAEGTRELGDTAPGAA